MSLHLLCVRLCASEARAFFGSRCCSSSSFFMAIALARHHVWSCDTFTASDCTHTITACSCDTFTASTLHAHHHGMLVWHLSRHHHCTRMRHLRGILCSWWDTVAASLGRGQPRASVASERARRSDGVKICLKINKNNNNNNNNNFKWMPWIESSLEQA